MKAPLQISTALARLLVEKGLAAEIDGVLYPAVSGGDPAADNVFPSVPEDIAALSDEDLASFVEETAAAIAEVGASPAEFVSEAYASADLLADMEASVEALASAREEAAKRAAAAEEEPEVTDEELSAATAALAAQALSAEDPDPDPEPEPEPEPVDPPVDPEPEPVDPVDPPEPETVAVVVEPEPVVAAAPAPRPRPTRARTPQPTATKPVALTAAAGATDLPLGYTFPSELEVAKAMVRRHGQFGRIPEGLSSKEPIAAATWSDRYPEERVLTGDVFHNEALIASVTDPEAIKRAMRDRKKAQDSGALVASGGLCAPVTPYYDLQMLSQADRPVRAALASFSAERGGIRFGRPASLVDVDTAIGYITAEDDAAGGTFATKSCQIVECPPFEEVDVATIYHCLQFGNLGARTFPERVTQWNALVLAAQARLAESALLTSIDAASTQVTAASLGLGATGALLGQILAAANGMRNRHRMDPEAVLRLMLPDWALDLLVSDVIRSQFERFSTDEAKITALLRSFDIEPSFYIDGANGRNQVFGPQGDGALLPFPETVVWYLYPEGSFLYLDGGTLELGLVRDSVLNSTNDFQIFGESFENVAFIGIESLAVESTICDSGTVSLPHAIDCPIDYTDAS